MLKSIILIYVYIISVSNLFIASLQFNIFLRKSSFDEICAIVLRLQNMSLGSFFNLMQTAINSLNNYIYFAIRYTIKHR